jgi:endonuclease/exonuclease/phosphatase family metal-dependent hydrolase
MLTFVALMLAAVAFSPAPALPTDDCEPLRVVSFNIRFDNPGDGPDAWPHRRDAVAGFLRFHEADLIGLQEALHHQNTDLGERLPGFTWIGVGRDDGLEGGEYSSLFYRAERFDLVDWGTFWLSEHPADTGAVGWDADFPRVVTWAQLNDRQSDRRLFVYNTHFDHVGKLAREQSARMIVEHIETHAQEAPVIFMGDLNVTPNEQAVQTLVGRESPLRDAIDLPTIPHYGPRSTWNAFREVAPDRRIDYILVTDHFAVRRHAILTDRVEGRFLSDHLPVFAEVCLTSSAN